MPTLSAQSLLHTLPFFPSVYPAESADQPSNTTWIEQNSPFALRHGRLFLGVRLVMLPKLPETLSCPPVILTGAL